MWRILLVVVAALVVGAGGFLVYVGLFDEVVVSEKEMGPYHIAYVEHQGDYSAIGGKFDDLARRLENYDTQMMAGVYFDDPAVVNPDDLRSFAAMVIKAEDALEISKIEGVEVGRIRRGEKVVGEFPLRNYVGIVVGMMKAYPTLEEYCENNNCPEGAMMEIYDFESGKVEYVMGVAVQ